MVAAIALLKAEMAEDCGNPSPGANQLLDAAVRAKVLAALRCHQRQVDRIQSGLHKLNQDYEVTVLELKLPAPHQFALHRKPRGSSKAARI
jgi:hypothetical protein